MMALSLHSVPDLTSTAKLHHVSRSFIRHSNYSAKKIYLTPVPLVLKLRNQRRQKDIRWNGTPLAIDDEKATAESTGVDTGGTSGAISDDPLQSPNTRPNASDEIKLGTAQALKDKSQRSPLTAREKLRAAWVLSRYTDSKPSKSLSGSRVLDALRESEKGKKRSGLPEAPSNLFDDGKRGMPKAGLTFDFPGGSDLLIIAFSFVFISTVMFATTYIVWKLGAIHFNEY